MQILYDSSYRMHIVYIVQSYINVIEHIYTVHTHTCMRSTIRSSYLLWKFSLNAKEKKCSSKKQILSASLNKIIECFVFVYAIGFTFTYKHTLAHSHIHTFICWSCSCGIFVIIIIIFIMDVVSASILPKYFWHVPNT